MSIDKKSAPPKQKLTLADLGTIAYVGLFDERRRIWGFFTPEDAAMLKTRTEAEWYSLSRKLLAEHPTPPGKLAVIPYEENAGKVRGRFFITPWSDKPVALPPCSLSDNSTSLKAITKRQIANDEFRRIQ